MSRPLLSLVILSLLAPQASAGKVRVVATTGAPYVRVQDAINAAQKGDVILVKSAAQDSMRINQKWLAIVADTGVTIQQTGAVRVTNMLPGTLVVLSGVAAQGILDANVSDLGHGILAEDNQGQIFAQDSSFTALTGNQPCNFASDGAFVRNSAGVAFTRCTLTGSSLALIQAPSFNGYAYQGNALNVTSSNIACAGVAAHGGGDGVTCMSFFPDGGNGGHGATLLGSSLFVSGSVFAGGSGGDAGGTPFCTPNSFGGSGGNGIRSSGTTVRLLATTTSGAIGGYGCGLGLGGAFGAPIVGPTTTIAGTQRLLNGPRLVRDTSPAVFAFTGVTGENVEIAVSINAAGHTFDAAQKGVLHVSNPRWRPVGVIPPSGVLTRSYKLPDLPLADPGAIFIVQARFINTVSGAVQISNPHVLIEVDATY